MGMHCAKWLVVAALTASLRLSAQSIEYFVEKSDDSFFGALRARANGKTYTIIDKSKEMCLAVADQRDWDGNSLKDALIERISACGGNCCPNYFFFVSAFPGGRFEISDDLADSWGDPKIEKWKNAWSVVLVSTNEGMNTDRPKEVTRRFILRDGKGLKVSESLLQEMGSIVEMRSEIFKGGDPNEEHIIKYDLDGDGKPDVISGRLWERWGRIIWTVRFASGKSFTTQSACKRIGVLQTTSSGVHDLVCDQDAVYRWTGTEYMEGAVPEATSQVKPSFDCGKATTRVELLICHDGALATLEVEMATAYKQALGRRTAMAQAALKQQHAAWFRNYSRTCNASVNDQERARCVSRFLTEHTADLKQP